MTVGPDNFLLLSAILFTIGTLGVLTRRDPLIIFMSIELMLNSVNLTFVTFSRYLGSADGQIFVFLVMTVAAAEVVVGLALIVSIFQRAHRVDVDDLDQMRG
jgi:NADH-quinone oxidoreductase subunit K